MAVRNPPDVDAKESTLPLLNNHCSSGFLQPCWELESAPVVSVIASGARLLHYRLIDPLGH